NDAAIATAEQHLHNVIRARGEIGDNLTPQGGDRAPAAGSGGGASDGTGMPTPDADALKRIQLAQAEDLLRIENQLIEARLRGDQARVDELEDYLKFKQLEQGMEK